MNIETIRAQWNRDRQATELLLASEQAGTRYAYQDLLNWLSEHPDNEYWTVEQFRLFLMS